MKCYACNFSSSIRRWRTINLSGNTRTTVLPRKGINSKPIQYYTPSSGNQYSNIYACPRCGTLKVKTPTDR